MTAKGAYLASIVTAANAMPPAGVVDWEQSRRRVCDGEPWASGPLTLLLGGDAQDFVDQQQVRVRCSW